MRTKLIIPGILTLAISLMFSSCEDKMVLTRKINQPVYKSKQEIRASFKKSGPRAMTNTGKIFSKGNYILITEAHKGLHVIDNSDPRNPNNIAFYEIDGALDIASKGDYLYVDHFMDVLVLDFSDPTNIQEVTRAEDVLMYNLPQRNNEFPRGEIDPAKGVVVDWEVVETKDEVSSWEAEALIWGETDVIDFQTAMNNPNADGSFAATEFEGAKSVSGSVTGKSGSMSRFITYNDYLYAVDGFKLLIFSTANDQVALVGEHDLWIDAETVFILRQKLFIGGRQGVQFYTLDNPEYPTYESLYSHVEACDPFIADGDRGYLTIRSGNLCGQTLNQLEILDIQNISFPTMLESYSFVNPHGLAKAGNLLFICDGSDGLKVFDASDDYNLTMLDHETGFTAKDVIVYPDLLMMMTDNSIYQYDYSDPSNLVLLSSLSITE